MPDLTKVRDQYGSDGADRAHPLILLGSGLSPFTR
jgi:hypothetical protein